MKHTYYSVHHVTTLSSAKSRKAEIIKKVAAGFSGALLMNEESIEVLTVELQKLALYLDDKFGGKPLCVSLSKEAHPGSIYCRMGNSVTGQDIFRILFGKVSRMMSSEIIPTVIDSALWKDGSIDDYTSCDRKKGGKR